MTDFEVFLSPEAEEDLAGIFDHIARRAGRGVARRYLERLERVCLNLEFFPERGTSRDDLRPGLRTIGFERRATILFRVDLTCRRVFVLGVFHGGRRVAPPR